MSPPVTREPTRPIPWTVIAAAGVAVAATGAFAYFGVRGLNERSDLDSCRGSCSHDAIETAKTHLIVADVFLAAAVVGYAVAGVLFFNRPAIER
jgi:hypothetical protein